MSSTVTPMRWWHVAAVQGLESELFPSDPWSAEQFWSELAQPTRRYLVALDGDDVLGYAGMFVLPPDADVQTVGVAPSAQGRGVARALLSRLFEGVDTDGVTHTMLEVRGQRWSQGALHPPRLRHHQPPSPLLPRWRGCAHHEAAASGRWRMTSPMVLGIETSCDETGIGIVSGGELLANEIASSVRGSGALFLRSPVGLISRRSSRRSVARVMRPGSPLTMSMRSP